ncbi:MAG: Ubiquitin carboxyl-terminal hydrolase 42, partial [Paramarteilia canceri]
FIPDHVQRIVSSNSISLDSKPINNTDTKTEIRKSAICNSIGSGLANLGNSCYINAAIQCLIHILHEFFLDNKKNKHSSHPSNFCTLCTIVSLASRSLSIQKPSKPLHLHKLVNNVSNINKQFKRGKQGDSHEFLRSAIDQIQQSLTGAKLNIEKEQKTVLFQYIGGFLQNRVRCSVCDNSDVVSDPFMDLSLDLPPPFKQDSSKSNKSTLQSCLQHYFSEETISKVYGITGDSICKNCKSPKAKLLKKFSIDSSPNFLTIHLKRFYINRNSNNKITMTKNNSFISYPDILDLSPFVKNDFSDIARNDNQRYSLQCMIIHLGNSIKSGHYIAIIKQPSQSPISKWFIFDDERVEPINPSQVWSYRPYILIYKKLKSGLKAEKHITNLSNSFISPSSEIIKPKSINFGENKDYNLFDKHFEPNKRSKAPENSRKFRKKYKIKCTRKF